MSTALDMSLDDVIKQSKARQDGNYGFSHGRVIRPNHRLFSRWPLRTSPYPVPELHVMEPWLFQQEMALGGGSNSDIGTKLYISNLEYGVSNEDIKLLFSEIGELKRYSIHYDKSGRSKGTAEVVYVHKSDALTAMKRYDNVKLDGKPLKIELVGVNMVGLAALPPTPNGILGRPKDVFKRVQGSGFRSLVRSNTGGNLITRDHGQPRSRGGMVTAKDLDADLDNYRLQAMKIKKNEQ